MKFVVYLLFPTYLMLFELQYLPSHLARSHGQSVQDCAVFVTAQSAL